MNITGLTGFLAAICFVAVCAWAYNGVEAERREDEKANKNATFNVRAWFVLFVIFGAVCAASWGR